MIFYKLIKLLFFIGYIDLCFSENATAPHISFITPEQIKDINSTVELNCTISDYGNYNVMWMKKFRDRPVDPVPLALSDQLFFKDPRYELNHDNITNSYVFKIKDIIPDDTGIYECQIRNTMSASIKTFAYVEVLVRQPPQIIINETTRSTISVEGDTVKLTCMADGYPRPTVTWQREYDAILPNGGHSFNGYNYKIINIRKEDRGTYICRAENGVGKADIINVDVEVEFPPSISVPRPKVAQAIHYSIELECLVEAYPAPSIIWKRDGKQLFNNAHYTITQIASENEVTKTTLKVNSLEHNEYGDYKCEATNKLGNAQARLHLFESKVPDINFAGVIWSRTSSFTKTIKDSTIFLLCLCILIFSN